MARIPGEPDSGENTPDQDDEGEEREAQQERRGERGGGGREAPAPDSPPDTAENGEDRFFATEEPPDTSTPNAGPDTGGPAREPGDDGPPEDDDESGAPPGDTPEPGPDTGGPAAAPPGGTDTDTTEPPGEGGPGETEGGEPPTEDETGDGDTTTPSTADGGDGGGADSGVEDTPSGFDSAGLENSSNESIREQAADLEQEFLEKNPMFNAADVKVVRTGDGEIRTEVSPEARRRVATSSIVEQLDERFSATDLDVGDIEVVETDDGGFRGRLTEAAEERIVDEALDSPGTRQAADAVVEQRRQEVGGAFREFSAEDQQASAAVESIEAREQRGDFSEFESRPATGALAPENVENRAEAAVEEIKAGQQARVQQAVEEVEVEAEQAEFTLAVPEGVPIIGGEEVATIEGRRGDFEVVETEAGGLDVEQREEFELQEGPILSRGAQALGFSEAQGERLDQFVNFATPFNLRPGRTEKALRPLAKGFDEAVDVGAAGVGSFVATGGDRFAAGEAGLRFNERMEAQDDESVDAAQAATEALEEDIEAGSAGAVAQAGSRGFGSLLNVPATGLAATEAAETTGAGVEAVSKGEGAEFRESLEERGAGAVAGFGQAAAERPVETGAAVGGSLVGSVGAFRLANRVGPRTSTATKFAIQPGEELAGAGGFRLTKAVAGEKRAQQLFPNKEPLIFSEEAAIRGAKGAGSRLHRALDADTLQEFRTSSRGQADLTGLGRRKAVETEGETGEDVAELADVESISEVEDAAEQRRDQLRFQTNVRLEQRSELEPDPEPPDPQTVTQREFSTVTHRPTRGVSGGPDLTRSGPTAGQMRTFTADIKTETGGAESRVEAAETPEVRLDDELLGGTRSKELALGDSSILEDSLLDAELRSDLESGFLEPTTEPALDTDVDTDVDVDTESDVVTDIDTDIDQRLDTEARTRADIDAESETESRVTAESEFRTESETELETELELELEAETETELERNPFEDFDSSRDKKRRGGEIFSEVFENPAIAPSEIQEEQRELLEGLDE